MGSRLNVNGTKTNAMSEKYRNPDSSNVGSSNQQTNSKTSPNVNRNQVQLQFNYANDTANRELGTTTRFAWLNQPLSNSSISRAATSSVATTPTEINMTTQPTNTNSNEIERFIHDHLVKSMANTNRSSYGLKRQANFIQPDRNKRRQSSSAMAELSIESQSPREPQSLHSPPSWLGNPFVPLQPPTQSIQHHQSAAVEHSKRTFSMPAYTVPPHQKQSPVLQSSVTVNNSLFPNPALQSPTVQSSQGLGQSSPLQTLHELRETVLMQVHRNHPDYNVLLIRFASLEQAYRNKDEFFWFLHLIHCNWLLNTPENIPTSIRLNLGSLDFIRLLTQAFSQHSNNPLNLPLGVPPSAILFARHMSEFPMTLNQFIMNNLESAGKHEKLFLDMIKSFSVHSSAWPGYVRRVVERKYPSLCRELYDSLRIPSREVLFFLTTFLARAIQNHYGLPNEYMNDCHQLFFTNFTACQNRGIEQVKQVIGSYLQAFKTHLPTIARQSVPQAQAPTPAGSRRTSSNVSNPSSLVSTATPSTPDDELLLDQQRGSVELLAGLKYLMQKTQPGLEECKTSNLGIEAFWALTMAETHQNRKKEKEAIFKSSKTAIPKHPFNSRSFTQPKQEGEPLMPLRFQLLEISNRPNPPKKTLHLSDLSDPILLSDLPLGPYPLFQFIVNVSSLRKVTEASAIFEIPVATMSFEQALQIKSNYGLHTASVRPGVRRFRIRTVKSGHGSPSHQVSQSDWAILDMSSPKWMNLQFNGEFLNARRGGHYGHFGKDQAHDVSKLVREGVNELRVWDNTFGREGNIADMNYWVGLETINYLRPEVVIESAQSIAHGVERVLNEIKDKLKSTYEGVVAVSEDLPVSVRDPITGMLISQLPVRSVDCRHNDCFGLEAFLASRTVQKRPEDIYNIHDLPKGRVTEVDVWKCPICSSDARPLKLYLDKWMLQVRDTLAAKSLLNATQIVVKEDGSWTVKDESRQCPATQEDRKTERMVDLRPPSSGPVVISLLDNDS
jgi:hypothetical protein